MNKTIFNLNYKSSVIIMSLLGIIFGFLSNVFYINGFLELIFYVFRFFLFIGVYLLIYLFEKNNNEFKVVNKRMMGMLIISSISNSIFAIFAITHLLSGLFVILSGVVCFILIVYFVMEIINVVNENKICQKIININEKIGSAIANPIVKYIESKITND